MSIGAATTSPRTSVRLVVLPDFELRVDGARFELRPASMRLIGYLALQRGMPVPRGVASSALWPEVTDVKAGASLRSAIWRLGRVGPHVVGASSTHVWLDAMVDIDLVASTDRANELLRAESVGPADVHLTQDLGLLSSDLLVGWFEDWALDQQEGFRQLRLHALDRLGVLLLDAGRHVEAIRVGQVAVACEPFRETAQALLIRAHLAEGNVAEALRQFRSFAELLATELGIAPSCGLTRLVDDAFDEIAIPDRELRTNPRPPRPLAVAGRPTSRMAPPRDRAVTDDGRT